MNMRPLYHPQVMRTEAVASTNVRQNLDTTGGLSAGAYRVAAQGALTGGLTDG